MSSEVDDVVDVEDAVVERVMNSEEVVLEVSCTLSIVVTGLVKVEIVNEVV